jgi:hypothetical protein
MVLAYVMWQRQLPLSKAYALVKALRPSINPNAGFRLQVKGLCKRIRL